MNGDTRQRGFTLMEVLIAMVILSFGMMAAIKIVSQVSASAIQSRDNTYAQWVALNKIAELRLQTTWPSVGKKDGETDMAGQTWHWVTQIKATPNKDIRQLDVSVSPASEKNSNVATIVVTAYLGRPL